MINRILQRAADGRYGEDSAAIGKAIGVLLAAKFDSGVGPFICGALGERGSDGLHTGYLICPSYGADVQLTKAFVKKLENHDAGSE